MFRRLSIIALLLASGCGADVAIELTVRSGDSSSGNVQACDLAKCEAAGTCGLAACSGFIPLQATNHRVDLVVDDNTTETVALQFTAPCAQLNVDVGDEAIAVSAVFTSSAAPAGDPLAFECPAGSCERVECTGASQ